MAAVVHGAAGQCRVRELLETIRHVHRLPVKAHIRPCLIAPAAVLLPPLRFPCPVPPPPAQPSLPHRAIRPTAAPPPHDTAPMPPSIVHLPLPPFPFAPAPPVLNAPLPPLCRPYPPPLNTPAPPPPPHHPPQVTVLWGKQKGQATGFTSLTSPTLRKHLNSPTGLGSSSRRCGKPRALSEQMNVSCGKRNLKPYLCKNRTETMCDTALYALNVGLCIKGALRQCAVMIMNLLIQLIVCPTSVFCLTDCFVCMVPYRSFVSTADKDNDAALHLAYQGCEFYFVLIEINSSVQKRGDSVSVVRCHCNTP